MFQSTLIFEPNIPGERTFFFWGKGQEQVTIARFCINYQIACLSVDWRQWRSCVSRCLLRFVLACTQSCSGQQSGAQCRAGSTQTIFLPLPCSSQQSGSTRLAYIIGTPSSLIFFRRFCCSYLLLCPRLPELHQEEEVV